MRLRSWGGGGGGSKDHGLCVWSEDCYSKFEQLKGQYIVQRVRVYMLLNRHPYLQHR